MYQNYLERAALAPPPPADPTLPPSGRAVSARARMRPPRTTTALQHPREPQVCPVSRPCEPTENLVLDGHAPTCVVAPIGAVGPSTPSRTLPRPPSCPRRGPTIHTKNTGWHGVCGSRVRDSRPLHLPCVGGLREPHPGGQWGSKPYKPLSSYTRTYQG